MLLTRITGVSPTVSRTLSKRRRRPGVVLMAVAAGIFVLLSDRRYIRRDAGCGRISSMIQDFKVHWRWSDRGNGYGVESAGMPSRAGWRPAPHAGTADDRARGRGAGTAGLSQDVWPARLSRADAAPGAAQPALRIAVGRGSQRSRGRGSVVPQQGQRPA